MKVAPLVIGIISVLFCWVPLTIWYTLDLLSMGLCSILTCCMGDLAVWLLTAVMFFGGIGLIIYGAVSESKKEAPTPEAPAAPPAPEAPIASEAPPAPETPQAPQTAEK
jgi:hypothetical protein